MTYELLLFKGYIGFFGVALVFWTMDQFLCDVIGDPVYAHSLWHGIFGIRMFVCFYKNGRTRLPIKLFTIINYIDVN